MSGAEQSGGQDTVGKVGIRLSVGGPGRWELEKGAVVDTRQDGTSQQASRQPSSKEREHDALTVAVQSRLWHAKGEGVREGDGRWEVGGGRWAEGAEEEEDDDEDDEVEDGGAEESRARSGKVNERDLRTSAGFRKRVPQF